MADQKKNHDSVNVPPFETEDLRKNLSAFLNSDFPNSEAKKKTKIGNFKWGVYAFYDYDGEPIYIGQTNEQIRTRVRRHLTNQRTDAVAMSVLDPFEVFEIEIWPLPGFQKTKSTDKQAKAYLNALEHAIYRKCVDESKFKVVLNEKDPPSSSTSVAIPSSMRSGVVSDEVSAIRNHPDFRTARRALVIARLAQVISERKVQGGLRRVLLAQAKRLQWLADRRYKALGGSASVEKEDAYEEELTADG